MTVDPPAGPAADPPGDPAADPAGHAPDPAVVDLFGALAYGELTAFYRLAADAELAPTLETKAALARMAVVEFGHFERIRERLEDLGADPEAAMQPFVTPFDAFHERTAPSDWLEGLVKAYVGDGIAGDFYREIAALLDPQSQTLVNGVLADAGQAEFIVTTVRTAIEQNPRLSGRLALWARRLVGEALSQGQRVAADRDALIGLMVGTGEAPGADLAEITRMFSRLTDSHTRRMSRLGLSG